MVDCKVGWIRVWKLYWFVYKYFLLFCTYWIRDKHTWQLKKSVIFCYHSLGFKRSCGSSQERSWYIDGESIKIVAIIQQCCQSWGRPTTIHPTWRSDLRAWSVLWEPACFVEGVRQKEKPFQRCFDEIVIDQRSEEM